MLGVGSVFAELPSRAIHGVSIESGAGWMRKASARAMGLGCECPPPDVVGYRSTRGESLLR